MLTKSSATHKLLMDEELLAFAPNSFDLVISNLNLHLVNDLPGTLSQIRSILKPGGLLLGSILGGDSLTELKQAMLQCDLAKFSATCPHIIPMIDIKTMGQLLQRTGFSMPVTDNESLVICYDHVLKLMYDLRLMGQGNILRDRAKRYLGRDYFNLLQQYYRQLYPLEDGISCSFEVVYFMGIVSY
jgi:SAM-dependent methyltransferase